ncbi:ATP-binding protein [Marinobacter salarius]
MQMQATARASKRFFISMITRDISLEDCILDLIDNSVDAISKNHPEVQDGNGDKYKNYPVELTFDGDSFEIKDNSGGISLSDAKDYAFRFGRPDDDQQDEESNTIGHYGIGMKRAIFKLGNKVWIQSSTGSESFELDLDVEEWRKSDRPEWEFTLDNVMEENTTISPGTHIKITQLHPNIERRLKDPNFETTLVNTLKRDYSFIISHGLELYINGTEIEERLPSFKSGDSIKPHRATTEYEGIKITITAGMAITPEDDDSAEKRRPDSELYGWYVVCNERVVVAGDKSMMTGWGVKRVPSWHPQYYGFIGIVTFEGSAGDLPWTTTKRNIDPTHPAYTKALSMMKDITRKFTSYTNC